ncbi:hypothetical protein [Pseudonocardia kunmingensis]|uniref:Uncharacterized protein n=1 Tax=Pseudonocardia kunmingensis TaxID=630975 RepID=A0A543CWX8_9PSEU|nr:hypothetical protein [Pseudonocardia kunmingensis]TQM01600.1 hypothetical protein FB558_8491 [Pseudonocardia kunmingensis]
MSRLDTALSVVRTVFTARLAPVLLLVFVVVWPLAGFPRWPLVLVLGLAVVLRVLGFGYLLAGKRGPVLLVALLLVTTLGAWSPWLAVTALGAGIAVAGAFRLPRWQLLAVGMVLFLCAGAGWVTETVIAAQQRAASYEQTREHNRAQILPRSPPASPGRGDGDRRRRRRLGRVLAVHRTSGGAAGGRVRRPGLRGRGTRQERARHLTAWPLAAARRRCAQAHERGFTSSRAAD